MCALCVPVNMYIAYEIPLRNRYFESNVLIFSHTLCLYTVHSYSVDSAVFKYHTVGLFTQIRGEIYLIMSLT